MFAKHGNFHLELKGNLLFITISGAWNREAALEYESAIVEATKPLIGIPWAVITVIDDWELCTPDSALVMVGMIKTAIKNGLVREAVVNSKGTIKLEIYEKYKKEKRNGPDNKLFVRHIFQNSDAALEWLSKDGFSAQHQVN
jgi:hypothetical protein